MQRRLMTAAVVLAVGALAVLAEAKRVAPKDVTPVTQDGIEYSAPLAREGCVVATWVKDHREIWSRQIYVIKHEYLRGLEADVQTCFITRLQLQDGKLRVWNERGGEFELDLRTLEVKVLKGSALIDFARPHAAD